MGHRGADFIDEEVSGKGETRPGISHSHFGRGLMRIEEERRKSRARDLDAGVVVQTRQGRKNTDTWAQAVSEIERGSSAGGLHARAWASWVARGEERRGGARAERRRPAHVCHLPFFLFSFSYSFEFEFQK
jgi:hypothetical protein